MLAVRWPEELEDRFTNLPRRPGGAGPVTALRIVAALTAATEGSN